MNPVCRPASQGEGPWPSHVPPPHSACPCTQACGDKHADLRQCSAYGVGIVAEKAPAAFKPYISTALAKLSAIINAPDARDDDNECATDNAISALGSVVAYHADSIDNKAVPTAWLAALPVKGDTVEAQKQHELLAKLVAAQDQRILGEGNSNLPKIVSVFVQVRRAGMLASCYCTLHTCTATVPCTLLLLLYLARFH
jgi:hypothetical protein